MSVEDRCNTLNVECVLNGLEGNLRIERIDSWESTNRNLTFTERFLDCLGGFLHMLVSLVNGSRDHSKVWLHFNFNSCPLLD